MDPRFLLGCLTGMVGTTKLAIYLLRSRVTSRKRNFKEKLDDYKLRFKPPKISLRISVLIDFFNFESDITLYFHRY
ncbi:hypothetical protein DYH56_10460 [Psychrilyobacter piezotolerans]|uniref:Uncharacterized protein n=1 Tax=Psychrilyobacter piezotolerans TaxID=2293438 RepID=A0ABX9KFJ8_9FUSO|nr:hypothetical protein DV867_10460 [Psychrilyobacter sp. S5]REI40572.1 hypothetical protein DYH56_10460 [Psychrilyobacter piezotolerans]